VLVGFSAVRMFMHQASAWSSSASSRYIQGTIKSNNGQVKPFTNIEFKLLGSLVYE
jgi:hypothetical protein